MWRTRHVFCRLSSNRVGTDRRAHPRSQAPGRSCFRSRHVPLLGVTGMTTARRPGFRRYGRSRNTSSWYSSHARPASSRPAVQQELLHGVLQTAAVRAVRRIPMPSTRQRTISTPFSMDRRFIAIALLCHEVPDARKALAAVEGPDLRRGDSRPHGHGRTAETTGTRCRTRATEPATAHPIEPSRRCAAQVNSHPDAERNESLAGRPVHPSLVVSYLAKEVVEAKEQIPAAVIATDRNQGYIFFILCVGRKPKQLVDRE